MFSESLVESSSLLRSRNRLPALISVGLQVTVAATLIAIPMLHPEILPTAGNKLSTLAPPPTPVPPQPQVRPRVVATTSATTPTAPATAPSRATEAIRSLLNLTGPAMETPVYAASSMGNPDSALPAGLAPAAPVVSVASRPGPAKPLAVSSGVIAGLLIAPIRPQYPPIALTAHMQGTVVIQAIIAKDGRIESAHIVSGPPLLQMAALDAVRSARYHPYRLNGEPTEVETTISIIFHIGE
jgi:protein TonB